MDNPGVKQEQGAHVSPEEALHRRIERDFHYHRPSESMGGALVTIRETARSFAHELVELVPNGRELSTALTKLEECVMHANAGIARAGRTARG